MKSLFLYITILVVFSMDIARSTSSATLLNNTKFYDKKIITFQGEVIGEKMIRGKYAWLNANDGYMAIGIWAKSNLVQKISCFGNYFNKGDFIEVTGVFHQACREHGGDLDIHAFSVRKIFPGKTTTIPLNKKKLSIAVLLTGLVGTYAFLFRSR